MGPVSREPSRCPDHPDAKRVERLIVFDCMCVVPEVQTHKRRACMACMDQMFGGRRCFEHNPTPEMRDAQEIAA